MRTSQAHLREHVDVGQLKPQHDHERQQRGGDEQRRIPSRFAFEKRGTGVEGEGQRWNIQVWGEI